MTLADFGNNLNSFADNIKIFANEAINAGIDEAENQIQTRIFNDNLDINGKSFGKYRSKEYKALRLSLGRQIAVKDLQFTGNLFQEGIIKDYDSKQLLFKSELDIEKARTQERQLKTKIFELSEEEVDIVVEVIDEVFIELFNENLYDK